MSLTPHHEFWPLTRDVQPLFPAKPFDAPLVSCSHAVDGGAPLPLGQPDGYQCQHDPIGLVGPEGTAGANGSVGGGGGGSIGGGGDKSRGGAGGALGGGEVGGGVDGGSFGGSVGGSADGSVGGSADGTVGGSADGSVGGSADGAVGGSVAFDGEASGSM